MYIRREKKGRGGVPVYKEGEQKAMLSTKTRNCNTCAKALIRSYENAIKLLYEVNLKL
jgi:hypothetical protein